MVEQGDIVKIEGVKDRALVISKDFYNQTGKVIVCPVLNKSADSSFTIDFQINNKQFFVTCDSVRMLDLRERGHRKIARIPMNKLLFITDLVQSIIDYY